MADVELTCDSCGAETLATDGCWAEKCWRCGGRRVVTKRHDHALTWEETKAAGFQFQIVRAGVPPPSNRGT